MGLPHHRPVQEYGLPASNAAVPPHRTEATTAPIDVNADHSNDVAPDILENKSVKDVVPAPVPPADPDPATEPALKRFDIEDPAEPETLPLPAPEEHTKLSSMLVPDIQPVTLRIPASQQSTIRPASPFQPQERILVPATRMTSKRFQ